eukprot:1999636-Amphidinium_carterae.1
MDQAERKLGCCLSDYAITQPITNPHRQPNFAIMTRSSHKFSELLPKLPQQVKMIFFGIPLMIRA